MNFNARVDNYHLFMGRFSGWLMVSFAYFLYAGYLGDDTFKAAAIQMTGIGLLGPTFAGLYLEPKQTPMGHMPAHFLFLLAGILAATSP